MAFGETRGSCRSLYTVSLSCGWAQQTDGYAFPSPSFDTGNPRIWSRHHHKLPGLGHLARSVSRVTVALSIVSLVSQFFSFLVGCRGMILKGFGFVAFFAGVKASSFCIHLSCPVRSLSVVHGVRSRLFCGHKGRSLPEVSIASFLLPQFFVSVRLSKSNFLTHTKM
jgi:hypothetical protein